MTTPRRPLSEMDKVKQIFRSIWSIAVAMWLALGCSMAFTAIVNNVIYVISLAESMEQSAALILLLGYQAFIFLSVPMLTLIGIKLYAVLGGLPLKEGAK